MLSLSPMYPFTLLSPEPQSGGYTSTCLVIDQS